MIGSQSDFNEGRKMAQTTSNHSHITRFIHLCIALLIIGQLFSIYAVENKLFTDAVRTGLWSVHKYGGITVFFALFAFWINSFKRHHGTPISELFPWFSVCSLKTLGADCVVYLKQIISFKIPEHTTPSPLASAIHGLGIIIMSVMATTGVHRYIVYEFAIAKTPVIKYISSLHHTFADYAWIYLGIHVSMALVNHIAKKQSLSAMWCLRK